MNRSSSALARSDWPSAYAVARPAAPEAPAAAPKRARRLPLGPMFAAGVLALALLVPGAAVLVLQAGLAFAVWGSVVAVLALLTRRPTPPASFDARGRQAMLQASLSLRGV